MLHIHGQDAWHDDAIIFGTLESLELLKVAIDLAIESGYGKADLFCNDGEGFCLRVVKLSEEEMDKSPVPYTAEYAREHRFFNIEFGKSLRRSFYKGDKNDHKRTD